MVRPEGKLKTRKSTLGASKKDRISSATQRSSICTRSVYGGNHQRTPIRRVGGLRIEPREGKVPKSITTTTTATTTNSSNNNNNVEVGTKNSTRSSRSSISGNDTRDSPPPSPLDARPLMDCGHGTSNKLQTSKETLKATTAKPARAVAVVSPLVSSSNSNANTNTNSNSNSNSSRENKEYVERIEMVAMKNGKDQSFIRILTNKLSSKPKKQQQQDDAILVQLPSSRALRRAKKNKKEKDGDKSNSTTITATAAATATAVTFAAAVTFADDTEHTSKEASSLVETTTKTKTRKSKRYTPPILATIDSMELQELELCGHLDEMESTLGGCPIGCSTPPQFNNNSNNQNNSYNFNGKHRKSSTAALFDNIPEIAHSLAETTASAALQAKYSSSGNGNGNGDDNNGAASPLKQEKAFTKTSSRLGLFKKAAKEQKVKKDKTKDIKKEKKTEEEEKKKQEKKAKKHQRIEKKQLEKGIAKGIAKGKSEEQKNPEKYSTASVAIQNKINVTYIPVGRAGAAKSSFATSMEEYHKRYASSNGGNGNGNGNGNDDGNGNGNGNDGDQNDDVSTSSSEANSDSSKGFLGKIMSSWSNGNTGIPNNVSFVSDADDDSLDEVHFDDIYMVKNDDDSRGSDTDDASAALEAMDRDDPLIRVVTGIGNALFGKPEKDVRDLRILDSDISDSSSDDESLY